MTVSVCVCLSRVCMFVGPRSYLQKYTSDLYHFFAHVTCGGGLILLWRRRDTLCTSGFMGDVILAHKARQLNVSAHLMEAQPTCSLGLGYKRRVGIPLRVSGLALTAYFSGAARSGPTRSQWAIPQVWVAPDSACLDTPVSWSWGRGSAATRNCVKHERAGAGAERCRGRRAYLALIDG